MGERVALPGIILDLKSVEVLADLVGRSCCLESLSQVLPSYRSL